MARIIRKSLRPGKSVHIADIETDLLVIDGNSCESLRILNSRIGQIQFHGERLKLVLLSIEGCRIESNLDLSCNGKLKCGDLIIKDTKISGQLCVLNTELSGTCALHDLDLGKGLDIRRSKLGEFLGKSIVIGSGGVAFQRSEVENSLSLTDSTINGVSSFDDCRVKGPSDLSRTKFCGWFSAIRSYWGGLLRLSWSEGRGKRQFESGVDLTEAVVEGELVMESAGCGADLVLIGCRLEGGLNLHNAMISGHLEIRRSLFSKCFNAGGIHVLSSSHIYESSFGEGINLNRSCWRASLSLKNVKICADLTCEKAVFTRDLSLDSVEVLMDTTMSNAELKGSMSIKDCLFEKQFSLDGLELMEDSKEIAIARSDFLSRSSMCDMKLSCRRLLLADCTFGRQFCFRNNQIDIPELRLTGDDFQGLATFQGTSFTRNNSLCFSDIIGENIALSRDQLQGKLHVERPKKGGKDRYGSHLRNAKSYEWAMEVFQRNKKHSDEDWALYKALVEKHKANFYEGFSRPIKLFSMLKSVFIEYLGILFFWRLACGFGLRLWRLLIASCVVILLFTLIYSSNSDHIVHSDEALRDAAKQGIIEHESPEDLSLDELPDEYDMNFRHSLMYSANTFTSFGSGASFTRFGSLIGYVVILEGFLGLFFTTIFVGSAIRKVMRTG